MAATFAVVVPSIGRASLGLLLNSLAACQGPRPQRVVLVDDRRDAAGELLGSQTAPGWLAGLVTVVRSGGRGPAAARNVGWRAVAGSGAERGGATQVDWIAFLDDDVLVTTSWLTDLADDLGAPAGTGGVQGLVSVPLPAGRRPTDWERGTAGLATAKWITADMAYRLPVLQAVDGFDERFPRAFREDADLALRVQDAGWSLRTGKRRIVHPVRPAPWNASLRQQRGNADDVLMTRLHGRDWWALAQAPKGRWARHLAITAAGATGIALLMARRPRPAAVAVVLWAAGTAEFARARIAPGPRTTAEVAAMLATSVAIAPAASWHRLRGLVAHRAVGRSATVVAAVLVDRDGTIVYDVPYNNDPAKVEPVKGAREALDRLRAAGVPVGIISNQSGVARGLIDPEQLAAVNARVEELLGPFDVWQQCLHGEGEGCACRKPEPGMVLAAARALAVPVEQCLVIGDIGADVLAAQRAGAQAILVPTGSTRCDEVAAAPLVRFSMGEAVDHVLARVAR